MNNGSQGVLKKRWQGPNKREASSGTGQFGESPCGLSEKAKARFWEKVDQRSDDECWPWLAYLDENGYGQYGLNLDRKKTYKAHRVSYWITNGALSDDMNVLHRCDNPSCVNPRHLVLGTQVDNIRDMCLKGRDRHQRGDEHYGAKLTPGQVIEIRKEHEENRVSDYAIAKRLSMNRSTIWKILKRRSWKHI